MSPRPVIHGRDHAAGGADPIPGLGASTGYVSSGIRVHNTATQSIPSSTWTQVVFSTTTWSQNVTFDVAHPGYVTIGADGLYVVAFYAIFAVNNTGVRYAKIGVDGSSGADNVAAQKPLGRDPGTSTNYTVQSVEVLRLTAGQKVAGWVFQDSGSALNVMDTSGIPPGGAGLSVIGLATLTPGTSVNVATDTIWDAKGDLAVGTAPDTAAKLTVGTDGWVLTADSSQTTGTKWAAVPGSSATVRSAFVKRTAGDLTITNDSSWHDVPTIGDLTIAAATGDVLFISMNGVVDNGMRFEVQFPTSGNYAGPGITSTQGIAGWADRGTGATDVGGVIFYTVASGDISGGNVLCRLRYTTNSSGATKIFASTAVGPLTFGVINLVH